MFRFGRSWAAASWRTAAASDDPLAGKQEFGVLGPGELRGVPRSIGFTRPGRIVRGAVRRPVATGGSSVSSPSFVAGVGPVVGGWGRRHSLGELSHAESPDGCPEPEPVRRTGMLPSAETPPGTRMRGCVGRVNNPEESSDR